MPCPLPRWTQPVCLSVTSRSVQPSLMLWQVGVHNFTFEACSGFTRVTACRVAQPPYVAFVTRLRPGPAPRRPKPLVSYQTYRQLSGWDFHPLAVQELFQSLAIQVLGNCSLAWGAREGRGVRKDLRRLFLARLEASVCEQAAVTGCPKSGGANGSEIIRGESSPQCYR